MAAEDKILDVEELASCIENYKRRGRRIVQCHGVFDLLHIGHHRHFQEAKTHGDLLVVTITADEHIKKGPGRPVFNSLLRAEALSNLEVVDYVSIIDDPKAVTAIRKIRPNTYVKGPDYKEKGKDRTGGIIEEEEAVEEIGGELILTEGFTSSSSKLINQSMGHITTEVNEYVKRFKAKHTLSDIDHYLEGAQKLKVLVLGETIIDEYAYCRGLGKASKECTLAVQQENVDRFSGGILAVANHVAALCPNTQVLTRLGKERSDVDFIRDSLTKGIRAHFLYQTNAPTITKRRFIDSNSMQKLFEVYDMGTPRDTVGDQLKLCRKLEQILPKVDGVIVADYGHGLIGEEAVNLLCEEAKFLAVNTQMNAENLGYNTISKYKRADFVCITENELRLDARSKTAPLDDLIKKIARKMKCEQVAVTRGKLGTICYHRGKSDQVPALTDKVVDRIGAGDAVFAVAALCVLQQVPLEVVGLIANAVGSQAVQILGNQRSIDPVAVGKHLETLLK